MVGKAQVRNAAVGVLDRLTNEGEPRDAWIDAAEGVARFGGDAHWLDMAETKHARRGIDPGTGASTTRRRQRPIANITVRPHRRRHEAATAGISRAETKARP